MSVRPPVSGDDPAGTSEAAEAGGGPDDGVTIGAVVARLGAGLLRSVMLPRPGRVVSGVAILERPEDAGAFGTDIALAVGVADPQRLVALISSLGAEVGALAVKSPVEADDRLLGAALAADCALLVLDDRADWLQAAGLLQGEIAQLAGAEKTPAPAGGHPTPLDLFDLAELAAAAVGGPVTIEDERGWLLAYSRDQSGSDPLRVETLMNRRAPAHFSAVIRSRSLTQRLARSDEPVIVADVADGVADRLAVGLHIGSFPLGSMWAVVSGPDADAVAGFAQVARRAALSMLRRRTEDHLSQRIELEQLAGILHGGSALSPGASSFPLPEGTHWVVALAFAQLEATELAMTRARLEQRLAVMGRGATLTMHAGQLSNLWYLILTSAGPLAGGTTEVRAWVEALLTDHTGTRLPIYAGIGHAAPDRSILPQSRREAERALAVARNGARAPTTVDLETGWPEAVLVRMGDPALQADLDTLTPLAILQAVDERHDTGYVPSLRAWLTHHGNIRTAADSLHIHANTLRYRLEKLQQAARIDLADADTRLVLHLQLRTADRTG